MRRLWILPAVALTALLALLPALAQTPSGPRQAELSTVEVVGIADTARGYQAVGWASGTIVDNSGLIVTVFHVTGDLQTGRLLNPKGTVGLALVRQPGQPPIPAYLGQVITYSTSLDLALVQVTSFLNGTPLPGYQYFPAATLPGLRDRAPARGAALSAWGFAAGYDQPAAVVTGTLARYAPLAGFGGTPMAVTTTAAYAPGLAGGPVVDDRGVFAGLALGMSTQSAGAQGVVRPWEEIRAWATGHVTATQAAPPVVIAGRVVDHDSGRGIPHALFLVLKPGVDTQDFLGTPNLNDVAALGNTGSTGDFVTDPPVAFDIGYNMVVYAQGYAPAFSTRPIRLDEASCPGRPRCDFGVIELQSSAR